MRKQDLCDAAAHERGFTDFIGFDECKMLLDRGFSFGEFPCGSDFETCAFEKDPVEGASATVNRGFKGEKYRGFIAGAL